MARYADTLLSDGEHIAVRTRQHWLAPIVDGRLAWALLLLSLVALILSRNLEQGTVRDFFGIATLVAFLIALAWLVKIYWSWWAQDYIITNRRVLKVEGIINKRSADSSLEKINDAVLEQNLFGRMFGYGDLDILTAADVAIDRYRMLTNAPGFKREMLNQKHELEGEYSRMPSPPIRTGPPVAPPPAAPAAPPMSPDDVTRTLSQLADLRDRGAISAEEYEAKKAALLARL
jgi:hypothetical protein